MRSKLYSNWRCVFFLAVGASILPACSADSEDVDGSAPPGSIGASPSVGSGGSSVGTSSGGKFEIEVPAVGGASTGGVDPGSGGALPEIQTQYTLPAGFTPAEGSENGSDSDQLAGGYLLVGALDAIDVTASEACGNVLRVVVRDFEPTHEDFTGFKGEAPGMVGPIGAPIGADRKPVRDATVSPEVAIAFDDWYRHGDAYDNVPYLMDLWLEPSTDAAGNEVFIFDSSRFFPLPLENAITPANDDDRNPRNLAFTTELHTQFEYKGGEVFSFRGDDDVFVYINGALVVDIGGVHQPLVGQVEVDTLGLTIGSVYTFDLFQAERNPTGSNFRMETSLDFTGCGELLPGDIIIK
jgi:fibro-slime domain-containing protein